MNTYALNKELLEKAKERASHALAEHKNTGTHEAAQKFLDANDEILRLANQMIQEA